ncbi:MAG: hypothetical protein EVJ48_01705 [Candidatus Acidulodesulfobacterium acidiphilum]|uniref:Uncharacterized protein n=1 Tax=Candidatus Acidulodesulfobacterium acidiphilum TaxID=2597224 RepID=A0A520XGC1_9DELT|nr:MAG: hypothetical protein EVJ48_01705 [Candidatus Acidulodesulfobacterium acidiphilum]
MGYESTFDYSFSLDVKIKDIEELNEKIAKLDSGMGEAKILNLVRKDSTEYYEIEMDDYYGKFYDSEDFAELLSKHIVKGSADLIWTGEDGGIEAIRVYPDKTEDLECVYVPEYMADEVREYINSLCKNG